MSEITLPQSDDFLQRGLRLLSPAQVNRSVWTGRRKVVGLAGAEVWSGEAAIDLITTEKEERQWRAFLFNLANQGNWFRWPLPCHSHIGPKPTVAAGAGDGYTLPLESIAPNARILEAGQFMTVPLPSGHFRAVCLTADLIADADGEATAQFKPALGENPVVGATVETIAPFIPMAPVSDTLGLDLSDGVSGTTFSVEEAL